MINTELGYPATQIISLNNAAVRALAQVPSGVISLSNFYGKSSTVLKGLAYGLQGPTVNQFTMLQDFPTGTLTVGGTQQAGNLGQQMNSSANIYHSSGRSPSPFGSNLATLNTNKYNFSTATFTTNLINAPDVRTLGFSGNSSTNGYSISGSNNPPGGNPQSITTNKFAFSSETYVPAPNIPSARLGSVRKLQSPQYIYSMGGNTAAPPTAVSLPSIRLDMNTDTFATAPFSSPTPSSTVGDSRMNFSTSLAAYAGFMNAPAPFSGMLKITHSSQTVSVVASNPAVGNYQRGSSLNSGTVGTIHYARTVPASFSLRANFTFSTETFSTAPANTPTIDNNSGSSGGQPTGVAL